ncbi:TetR/AcrR family transcriptional regulator [Mycolicibacterium fluoranthenivorans]|uniref:AcrR family transcriptional regulator n=1 Tax=Mycolicibacterium fluoranthenivorans TaxID=258505 RepID=A0A7X5ZD06_9MYCO|nr:TetR/AcrR family transcriptional regulator [Mycolicibacterium fluoranthenivorans]NIH95560.1 AcrR family transcriptional regulator [Mycolicibacterium fluoranthenivorans]
MADAVAALFAEGGYEAVSVVGTADKLGVSRATLYRTVSTREDLLGILFERSTSDLTQRATALIASIDDPAERLTAMIRLQAEAAVNMRSYLGVFFGGVGVPADVYARWHSWSRQYEKLWVGVVSDTMEVGYLDKGNPVVIARLILGMMIWVSRWYRPGEDISIEEIAETATHLVRVGHAASPAQSASTRKRARGQR